MEKFVLAQTADFASICAFYQDVCESQKDDAYGADWHYGIYPAEKDLQEHLQKGELHICRADDGKIAAAAVLVKQADSRYANGKWQVKVSSEKVLTLHLLAVHPAYRGRHLAGKMLDYLFSYGKKNDFGSIQLDVLKGNLPAEQLYIKNGFNFIEECQVWYEDIGEQTVHLYEKDLR